MPILCPNNPNLPPGDALIHGVLFDMTKHPAYALWALEAPDVAAALVMQPTHLDQFKAVARAIEDELSYETATKWRWQVLIRLGADVGVDIAPLAMYQADSYEFILSKAQALALPDVKERQRFLAEFSLSHFEMRQRYVGMLVSAIKVHNMESMLPIVGRWLEGTRSSVAEYKQILREGCLLLPPGCECGGAHDVSVPLRWV